MTKVFNAIYVKNREKILSVTLFLYCVIGYLKTSTITNIYYCNSILNILLLLCAVILCFYLLFDLLNKKFKVTWFLIFGVFCAIGSLIVIHNTIICFFLAFLYVFKDGDLKKIAKIISYALLVSLVSVILLSGIGVIETLNGERFNKIRHSLGFNASTQASIFFFLYCLLFNFINKEKTPIYVLVLEIVANVLIYILTDTRTGFILTFIIVIISIILKIIENERLKNPEKKDIFLKIKEFFDVEENNKKFSVIFSLLPIFFNIIFALCIVLYRYNFSPAVFLNSILSNRFYFTMTAFVEKPMTLFGGFYNWIDSEGMYCGVDSSIYFYLFNWGIIPTIFILSVLTYIFYKAFRAKNYCLFIALIFILCEGMIDRVLFDIRYNVFLLSLIGLNSKMFFGANSENKNNKLNKSVKVELK